MPANKKLLILPGDGIGPEVMREVRRVIDWMDRRRMVSFDMSDDLVGGASIDARGTPITDEMVERVAEEAERGFDVDELIARRRGSGRPSLGEAAKGVQSVRLEQELRERVAQPAEADGVTFSEIVRRALREYLRSA